MPVIEGRKMEHPEVAETYFGAKLVLMFHDKKHTLNWVRVEWSPEEFGELFDRYCDWLHSTGQTLALQALIEKH